MHARQLVEIAALAACHGPALLAGRGHLSSDGFEQYWIASKCRLDRWSRAIKSFSQPAPTWPWNGHQAESVRIEALVEEIFASEILSRVWAALLDGYDRTRGGHGASYFGRGVYLGQLEARNRILKLLVSGPNVNGEQALRYNRFRQCTEQWSDLLVGCLTAVADVAEFAPHPDRARAIAKDLGDAAGMAMAPLRWQMTIASLRVVFLSAFDTAAANPDSNVRIAASVLRTFDSDTFDSTGLFPSLWITRLEYLSRDSELLLDEFFPTPAPKSVHDGDALNPHLPSPMPRRRFG